ncbi:MAG: DUF1501 domain-containing protein [Planctomycetota bacterium]|nr:DUF1501 domain-containing protein [Planctomycetota bacterium]MDA1178875.1 DUF1501 domain-containing protein [Planctomycetota bacterium]
MEQLTTSDRRRWLSNTGLGVGALGLQALLRDSGDIAYARETLPGSGGSMDRVGLHHTPRVRRVIHFFLNGGPSQVDTFDPKPSLTKYAGQEIPINLTTERRTGAAFPSPFRFKKFGQSGLEVSELFQHCAQHADDMAVIRSMVAQVPNHEPSLMLMNCGDSVQARPSVGAWVLYGLGTENQNLPGFVAMCPQGLPIKDTENWQAGFLPGAFQGTYIDSTHTEVSKLIANIEHPQVTSAAQKRQLQMLIQLNAKHQTNRIDERLDARTKSFELAFRMQMEATDAFDLSRESAATIAMYGEGTHARQTIIARRLIERGVRYVQLWHGGGQPWDNHTEITKNHRKLAAEIDRPIAALMADLKQRGMFEDTLIIWGGEFGRTPTVELSSDGSSKLGRDHNHYGFSVWMAGGGIRGGTAYGATDEFGFQAVDKPTTAHDLHATILHLLGIDHKRLTYRYAGRDFRLTDVFGNVVHDVLA